MEISFFSDRNSSMMRNQSSHIILMPLYHYLFSCVEFKVVRVVISTIQGGDKPQVPEIIVV